MQTGKPTTTTSIKRVFNAAGYSVRGLRSAFVNEAAFRQELALAVVMAPLGIWLGNGSIEKILLAGQAKDQGSAAVLIALALALFVWAMILVPRIF